MVNKFVVLLILLFFTVPAYAYLDPGTGSYILQILIGFILGALFAIKMYYQKIKFFFLNLFNKKKGLS